MKTVSVIGIFDQLESLADEGPILNFRLQAQVFRQTARLLRQLPSNAQVNDAILYVESCFTLYFGAGGSQFTTVQLQGLVRSSLDALRAVLTV